MKNILAWVIIQGLLRPLQWLPLALIHKAGYGLGSMIAKLPSRKHHIIERNLSVVYPYVEVKEIQALKKHAIQSTACFALEAGLVWHGSRARIDRAIIKVNGAELVERAQQASKGVLLVAAHLGNWEILNLYLMKHFGLCGLYRAPKSPTIDAWVRKTRQRFGGELVPSGSLAMRRLIKTLKNGQVAGIIADQQPKLGEGVMAPFLGQPAMTMTLVARLAQRTNCQVLMASCYRATGKGFVIDIKPIDDSIKETDPLVAATVLNQAIGEAIGQHPEQYLWRYRRFEDQVYR